MRRHLTSLSVPDTELYSDLAQNIRESYKMKETDGILELAVSSSMMVDAKLDIEETLVPAILDACRGSKGVAASIMNALIGSSCVFTKSADIAQNKSVGDSAALQDSVDLDGESLRLMSSRILLLMEALEKSGDIVPDVVTYSLAYRALCLDPDCRDLAHEILDEAERKSKKIAGGKRRKLLASARRQKVSTFVEAENSLKGILGDDFGVLLETDDFAVVNKPSGIPCFHKKKTTAGKIKRGKGKNKKGKSNKKVDSSGSSDVSLEDALISCNVNLSTLNPDALGLVHRLDRVSSGCIVLAKSNEMHAKLISEFFLRRTTKKYFALVRESSTSSIPEEGCGLIDNPVNGRPARSQYGLLERYQSVSDDEYEDDAMLLQFQIFTGRKHQIRVHAAEVLGSPVWGDPLYSKNDDSGNGSKTRSGISKRIFLHACRITIPRLDIDVESPFPMWWQSKISTFKSK
jgi:23S rRNA pseudouridine1911/1915/1917 synthase